MEWLSGSETTLIEALRQGNVDIVIGGYERASVWRQHASLSRAAFERRSYRGGPPGEAPRRSDLEGRRVAHHSGRPHVAALSAKANALMRPVSAVEFPERQRQAFAKARRLEWISIGYLVSAAIFTYLVMGSSQAMRTSWLEDMISLCPPIAFLIAARIARMTPSQRFPYGLHSSVSIGYLTASLALLGMGAFLLFEASVKLIYLERTTIGGFDLFGNTIWAGWPMLAALAYTGIPSLFLGRAKLKLAPIIHDKVLFADAEMNRADWMAESAAAIGVLGVGFGFWWLDSAEVRMREEGHVFIGEVFVVPKHNRNLLRHIESLADEAKKFNWRIQELTIMPVNRKCSGESRSDR